MFGKFLYGNKVLINIMMVLRLQNFFYLIKNFESTDDYKENYSSINKHQG